MSLKWNEWCGFGEADPRVWELPEYVKELDDDSPSCAEFYIEEEG